MHGPKAKKGPVVTAAKKIIETVTGTPRSNVNDESEIDLAGGSPGEMSEQKTGTKVVFSAFFRRCICVLLHASHYAFTPHIMPSRIALRPVFPFQDNNAHTSAALLENKTAGSVSSRATGVSEYDFASRFFVP